MWTSVWLVQQPLHTTYLHPLPHHAPHALMHVQACRYSVICVGLTPHIHQRLCKTHIQATVVLFPLHHHHLTTISLPLHPYFHNNHHLLTHHLIHHLPLPLTSNKKQALFHPPLPPLLIQTACHPSPCLDVDVALSLPPPHSYPITKKHQQN